jgi:hypothetical protein
VLEVTGIYVEIEAVQRVDEKGQSNGFKSSMGTSA